MQPNTIALVGAWVMGKSRLLRALIYVVLGAALALGQQPFGLLAVSLAVLVVVFAVALAAPNRKASGFAGWCIGIGYFALSLNWIVEPFLVDVARHGWMAPFALIFLSAGLALFWAASFAVTSGRGVWATALALAGFEGLRAVVFTGFPWGGLSQGLVDTPYAQGLAFVGPYGMSLALLLSIAAIARLLHCKAHWGIALGALILVPLFLPAPETPTSSGPIVRLIQPNAPQDQKWDPEMMPVFLDRSVAFTGAEGAPDVIIWPETSVPFLLRSAGPAFERISTAAGHTPLVLGLQRGQGGEYYNSLAVLDAQGQHVATYDKRHLVPFGEYIPFADMLGRFGLRGLADILGGGFTAGQGSQIIDIPGIGAAYALICYEGIFAHEIRYETRPRMLLMITNDAWFGNFSGPKQHLAQAQMRAIEQGLPLIRAANTGISAVIAPDGEIIAALGLGQAGYLDAQLPAALSPTLYSKFGDWPFWVSILFGAVLCIVMPLRHRP